MKHYRTPGWQQQPVFWSFSVAYKKPRGKRLSWVHTDAQDAAGASRQVSPTEGFIEYGVSKSFWRHWGRYNESITHEEYEAAVERGLEVSPVSRI